ncbi:MAG: hypothetical protein D6807_09590 [Alphaproteobacteria bacterium]|nr:MAG: hypothetical protein D6807_09590 [Alphaproteobacteria bacterium]
MTLLRAIPLILLLLAPTPLSAASDLPPARSAVTNCLAEPSRNCALAAALMVTADEELAITRVDNLAAVADALAHLGDIERARATVDLAIQAARDIGLSVATEQKLGEIVGILAEVGEAPRAIEIAEGLTDRFRRANALGAIALAQARSGDVSGAQATLDRIGIPLLALKYAVDMSEEIAESGQIDGPTAAALERRLGTVDHRLLRALGYTRLAVLKARQGDVEGARRLRDIAAAERDYILDNAERARYFAGLARAALALGETDAYADAVARARGLALRVNADFDQTIAISDVVAALAAGGRIDEAVALAGRVTDLRAQSRLVTRLAARRAAAAAVVPLARHVLDSINEDQSRFERDRARLAVARALAGVGAVPQAVEVIAAMENDDAQAQALAALAWNLD